MEKVLPIPLNSMIISFLPQHIFDSHSQFHLWLHRKLEFLLHVSCSLTRNNPANALPVGASLIVSIRKSTFSIPWSVKHQDLKFRQMFEKSERLWRILDCVIKLHPVIVFKFKRAVAVFDKVIPSVFIETVQSGVLKSAPIQPYTGCLINA